MSYTEAGTAIGARIPPTDEDIEILRRNIRRVMKWDHDLHPPGPHGEIVGSNILCALRNLCSDYLHFKPID